LIVRINTASSSIRALFSGKHWFYYK